MEENVVENISIDRIFHKKNIFLISVVILLVNFHAFPAQGSVLERFPKKPMFIEVPEELPKSLKNHFEVFWNSPTFQCKGKGIDFEPILKDFGIVSNKNDDFRGDRVAILYDPGNFPAILRNNSNNELFLRNGGVPQEGDVEVHMRQLKQHLEEQIPDKKFNGLGIIDFESWRPVFRQNFGSLTPYKDYSYEIERQRHPYWPESWQKKQASRRFEKHGRVYVEDTISFLKEMRPEAKWGYYAYPYCFNSKTASCSNQVLEENNALSWMWEKSDMLLPSVYLSKSDYTEEERLNLIKGRVKEALRISSRTEGNPEVIPYMWYRYRDTDIEFLSEVDMENAFKYMSKSGLPGMIMWGSSSDVNTYEKCVNLKNYVETVLGPLARKYKNPNRSAPKTNFLEELFYRLLGRTDNDVPLPDSSEEVETQKNKNVELNKDHTIIIEEDPKNSQIIIADLANQETPTEEMKRNPINPEKETDMIVAEIDLAKEETSITTPDKESNSS